MLSLQVPEKKLFRRVQAQRVFAVIYEFEKMERTAIAQRIIAELMQIDAEKKTPKDFQKQSLINHSKQMMKHGDELLRITQSGFRAILADDEKNYVYSLWMIFDILIGMKEDALYKFAADFKALQNGERIESPVHSAFLDLLERFVPKYSSEWAAWLKKAEIKREDLI